MAKTVEVIDLGWMVLVSETGKRVTLSHRLEYVGLKAVIFLMRLMPLDMASAFMGWTWRKIAPRLSRQKRAMGHLRLAFPEKSDDELYQITLDMWDNLGRTTAEGILVDRMVERARFFKFPPHFEEFIESLKKRNKGAMAVTLHSGNWELGGMLASQSGFDCAAVYQKMKNPLVDELVVSQRLETFKAGMFAKGDKAGTRLGEVIRRGDIGVLLGDLRDGRGHKVDFFGMEAPTNIFPARMARQLEVPLIVVRIQRLKGVDFAIDIEEIPVNYTDDINADIRDATDKVQAQFEAWIRAKPAQWMWAHERWGRQVYKKAFSEQES